MPQHTTVLYCTKCASIPVLHQLKSPSSFRHLSCETNITSVMMNAVTGAGSTIINATGIITLDISALCLKGLHNQLQTSSLLTSTDLFFKPCNKIVSKRYVYNGTRHCSPVASWTCKISILFNSSKRVVSFLTNGKIHSIHSSFFLWILNPRPCFLDNIWHGMPMHIWFCLWIVGMQLIFTVTTQTNESSLVNAMSSVCLICHT